MTLIKFIFQSYMEDLFESFRKEDTKLTVYFESEKCILLTIDLVHSMLATMKCAGEKDSMTIFDHEKIQS